MTELHNQEWVKSQHPDCGIDVARWYDREMVRPLVTTMPLSSNIETIGNVSDNDIFRVSIGKGHRHILVTGGVHGNEPAGAYAALDLAYNLHLDSISLKTYTKDFTIHIYPCMNPWSYEHDTRENEAGIDLNRGFKAKMEREQREL